LHRILLSTSLLFAAFSFGCATSTPVVHAPEPTLEALPTQTSSPTAPPLSFTPNTYRDDVNGFELDYPAGWTIVPDAVIGSRGSQAQLLSPGSTAETLAEGGSRVSITIYQWDPKHDLAAFVTQRRTAWDGGGSKVLTESEGDLVDGRKAMDFVVQAPDGLQAFFLFTTLGERYLQIAGEGNLALVAEIANTFRPLGPTP
jgi:hypothetical protein